MNTEKITRLVAAALMAAMTCVTTMVIAVPSPAGGFIHPGDGFVLLSGFILGPFYGGLAAGIGSMLADLLLGYTGYALATFIIKCLAAVIGYYVYHVLHKNRSNRIISVIIAGAFGGIIVTGGYFIFESIVLGLGYASAVLNVPANLVQNTFGILISTILFPLLLKAPQIRSLAEK